MPASAPAAAAALAAPAPRGGARAERLLLGGLAAWGVWFIARSSYVAGGRRVFCLFDDAMISMTYARNLVEGHGLNWARAGAPVEGFSHPLWLALMVPIQALGLDPRRRGLAVELASLLLLLLHVALVRRLTLRHFTVAGGVGTRHWLPAALLTACYYPLDFWSLVGMESALQALLTTASVLLALDIVCRGEDRHRLLLLTGAAAYLLRIDMLLLVVVTQACVLALGGLRQPRQRAHWWQGVAMLGAVIGASTALRWWIFGDLLPNTWYLKIYRIPLLLRVERGSWVLWKALADQLLPLAAAGAAVGVLMWREVAAGRRAAAADRGSGAAEAMAACSLGRRLLLPAALFVAACAYSVYVGGDAWEMEYNVRANRFVVHVMPQVFLIVGCLINEVAARLRGGAVRRRFVVAATAAALLSTDGLWLAAAPGDNWRDLLVTRRPRLIAEQAVVLDQLLAVQAAVGREPAVVATYLAGIPAYFSDYRMVDVLGYNERHIARLAPHLPQGDEDYQAYQPGHVKWDYAYLLAQYHPDVIMTPLAIDRHGSPWRLLLAAGYRATPAGFYRRLPAGGAAVPPGGPSGGPHDGSTGGLHGAGGRF
jgi:hypothetical protein